MIADICQYPLIFLPTDHLRISVRLLGCQQQMLKFLKWDLFTCNINLVNFPLNYQEAMDETFILSNIAPQVGDGFNRHC